MTVTFRFYGNEDGQCDNNSSKTLISYRTTVLIALDLCMYDTVRSSSGMKLVQPTRGEDQLKEHIIENKRF